MKQTPSTMQLDPADVMRYDAAFGEDPKNLLALNAVTASKVDRVAQDRAAVVRAEHTFSHLIKTPKVTDQKNSGRCWMFAGLNVLRLEAMKRLGLEQFELSQNYLMFYDKLEKANYFLETIIETLDEPTDGRLIWFLLEEPVSDGGQWDMFANLVRKYGVVPKSVMPETVSSGHTGGLNAALHAKLREGAAALRRGHAAGDSPADLRRRKDEQLETLYRIIAMHLGRPPGEFLWQWRDKDEAFHRDGVITPREFYERHVGFDLDSMVSLINCPTDDKPFGKLFTVQHLGNVVGGDIVRYVNAPLSAFKQAAVDMLVDGRVVWFGCDVGKMLGTRHGILDGELYDLELLYGTAFTPDKAERVAYGHSAMTHAMVFTGVDLDDDAKPVKWRVENSWGEKLGDKGYFVMSDDWFDEYMFEVVVDRKYLPQDLLAALETEPVVLPPWDPMGSLARAE